MPWHHDGSLLISTIIRQASCWVLGTPHTIAAHPDPTHPHSALLLPLILLLVVIPKMHQLLLVLLLLPLLLLRRRQRFWRHSVCLVPLLQRWRRHLVGTVLLLPLRGSLAIHVAALATDATCCALFPIAVRSIRTDAMGAITPERWWVVGQSFIVCTYVRDWNILKGIPDRASLRAAHCICQRKEAKSTGFQPVSCIRAIGMLTCWHLYLCLTSSAGRDQHSTAKCQLARLSCVCVEYSTLMAVHRNGLTLASRTDVLGSAGGSPWSSWQQSQPPSSPLDQLLYKSLQYMIYSRRHGQ